MGSPVWSALGVGRERQQRDGARALQGVGQRPLMLGARPGDAARQDLAPLGQEPAEAADLLVVDVVDALDAERADLAVGPLRPPVPSIGHRCHLFLLNALPARGGGSGW